MLTPPVHMVEFEAAAYWRPGEYDAAALLAALKGQAALADYDDDRGNRQSRVRLDHDADPTNVGFWITVPSSVDETVVDAGAAAYISPQVPSAEALERAGRELRASRDTWLLACQVIFDEIKNPGFHDLSVGMVDAIAANSAAWIEWRDAMRDLPDANGIDPITAAAALASITATDQEWPTPWPAPPAAPVIHTR